MDLSAYDKVKVKHAHVNEADLFGYVIRAYQEGRDEPHNRGKWFIYFPDDGVTIPIEEDRIIWK